MPKTSTDPKNATITVKMSERLRERFRSALQHEGLTISEFVVSRIEQFCREVENKKEESEMYNIYAQPVVGDIVAHSRATNRQVAENKAKEFAVKYPDQEVYIEYLRKTDGQRYYINPDGNADITGVSWSDEG